MFSNSGLAPNCMVILAVESTGKAFASGDLINRAFYHRMRRGGVRQGKKAGEKMSFLPLFF
jgi:hypothetical protein